MNTGLHGIRTLGTWLVRTLATRTVGTDNKNTWHKNKRTHGTKNNDTWHKNNRTFGTNCNMWHKNGQGSGHSNTNRKNTENLAQKEQLRNVVTLTVRTLRI